MLAHPQDVTDTVRSGIIHPIPPQCPRKVYNRWDFASIWAVFLTNAIVGEFSPAFALLLALVVGCVLSVPDFH